MNTLISDDKFIDDELLDKYQREMDNFTEFKIEYYDENEDQIKFASSKDQVKELKAEGNKVHRINSQPIKDANRLLQVIRRKQVIKKDVLAKKQRIDQIMVEKGLDEAQARLIYNQEKENEKLKKQIEDEKNVLPLKKNRKNLDLKGKRKKV